MKASLLLKFVAILIPLLSLGCFSAELYSKTEIDKQNNLHIYTNDGKNIIFKLEKFNQGGVELGQVAFAQIKISKDRHSVGWVAMYPNCCTSYPIPLTLNVYSNKKIYPFEGTGLPVWDWVFLADGQQVAFHQETVHGGMGVHYEIREVKTNKLISEFEPGMDEDEQESTKQAVPIWVTELKNNSGE